MGAEPFEGEQKSKGRAMPQVLIEIVTPMSSTQSRGFDFEGATGRLRVPVASLAEAAAGGSRWAAISDVVVAQKGPWFLDTKTKT